MPAGTLPPFGTACPTEQNSGGQKESTAGSAAAGPVAPSRDTDREHPCGRECHPQLSLPPGQLPPPEGTASGPLRRHLSLALPFCLFCSTGTAGFGTCLPLRDPSKTAQFLSPLEKICICGRGGLLWALTALPKGERTGGASAWLRHGGCRRTGRFPLSPCPTWESGHGSGPQLTGGIPLCAALVPWASRDPGRALGCSYSGRYIRARVTFPITCGTWSSCLEPKTLSALAADMTCKSGHWGKSLLTHTDPDG